MATILEFKSAPRPASAAVLADCNAMASAEVVLFPGIRYEREDGEEDKRKQRRHEPELED